MGIRRIVASIVLAAGLGACASDPAGLRYVDGSYYAGPVDGRGDYYVGRSYDNVRYVGDPFFDDFFWLHDSGPWYGGWYGSPFYGYGGYCSVRYRYCPPGGWGWADPFPRYDFRLYFGAPWDGYGHRWRDPWYDARPYDRWPRPRPRSADRDDDGGTAPPPRPRQAPPARPLPSSEEMPRRGRDAAQPFPRERRRGPRPVRDDGN